MGTIIDFALAAAHVRRRRRVRYVEPAPALETRFPCAHSGCRELVRAPGFCRACMTALSVARQADVRAMVRARRDVNSLREKDLARIETYGGRFMSKGIVADLLQAERELVAAELRKEADAASKMGNSHVADVLHAFAGCIERGEYLP